MTMKVKHRLTLGFGLLLAIIVLAMGYTAWQLRTLRSSIDELAAMHVPRAGVANQVLFNINLTARSSRTALLTDDAAVQTDQMQQLDKGVNGMDRALTALDALPGNEDSVRQSGVVRSAEATYRNDLGNFVALFKAGKHDEARRFLLDHARPSQLALMKEVDALVALEEGASLRLAAATSAAAAAAIHLQIAMGVLASLVAMTAGWLIRRSLMRELGGEPADAVKLMEELASGEVTTELKVAAGDEHSLFANLRRAALKAEENIRVRNALDVATANVMIADANNCVVYLNPAVGSMFRAAEADIRKEVPGFSATRLLGESLDGFLAGAGQPQQQGRLRQAQQAALEVGGRHFALTVTPVYRRDGALLGSAIEWQDRTRELAERAAEEARVAEERRIASENARIRIALDNVSTAVMIADNARDIIYINRSADALMSRRENDLRQALPGFAARELLGGSMDRFHRNPGHQRDMLANLRSNYRAEVKLAGLTFALSANPVFDAQGERLGSVVEWFDRTEEVRIEAEVGDIVGAAASGVFEKRISLEDKQGFFRTLGEKVNQLLNVTSQGLSDIASVLGALAQGDLTRHIENDYQGLFGTLKSDTNATVDNLRDIVRHIQESTELITGAASEISSGNSNLSQRTEEQAASLEETASSMEEITSTVRQNADNAKQANRLAIGASDTAGRGGKVVSQVVTTMTEINDSSRKIVDIISVIDGIAFQTNILALNAAVEAARAGEQGRGFAVVASEVRNLAQRSAAAAKEIKSLIGDSVGKVESGARLVGEAGRTMEEIVASIAQVAGIMSDISAASGEQSAGIEQISQAVTNMDENTQKNAALVEEAAAAAESLAEQAQQLSAAVSRFRLEAGAPVRRAATAPVARSRAAPIIQPAASARAAVGHTSRGNPAADGEWEEF